MVEAIGRSFCAPGLVYVYPAAVSTSRHTRQHRGFRLDPAMPGLLDVAHFCPVIVYVGWLPLLQLSLCNRQALEQMRRYTRGMLLWELGQSGLRLPPATDFGIGLLVRLLHTMAVSNLLRWDSISLREPWWSRSVAPAVELRVAVRYLNQHPARPWRVVRGRPIGADRLATVFAGGAFAGALETLATHGSDFRRHRDVHRFVNDAGGYLEGHRVEVVTLYATLRGFEVYLRWTQARRFDPENDCESSSASDSEL